VPLRNLGGRPLSEEEIAFLADDVS